MSYKATVLIESLASLLILSFSHQLDGTNPASQSTEGRTRFASEGKTHKAGFSEVQVRQKTCATRGVCSALPRAASGSLNLLENQILPCLPFPPLYLLQCYFPDAVFLSGRPGDHALFDLRNRRHQQLPRRPQRKVKRP